MFAKVQLEPGALCLPFTPPIAPLPAGPVAPELSADTASSRRLPGLPTCSHGTLYCPLSRHQLHSREKFCSRLSPLPG